MDPQWGQRGLSDGHGSSSASISGPLPSVSVCVCVYLAPISVICWTVMPLCFPLIRPEKTHQMACRMGRTKNSYSFRRGDKPDTLGPDWALKDWRQTRHTFTLRWTRNHTGWRLRAYYCTQSYINTIITHLVPLLMVCNHSYCSLVTCGDLLEFVFAP